MNNFHIYEEVGRGKYSVVYKVYKFIKSAFIFISNLLKIIVHFIIYF